MVVIALASEKRHKFRRRLCDGYDLECREKLLNVVLRKISSLLRSALEEDKHVEIDIKLCNSEDDHVFHKSSVKIRYRDGVIEAPLDDLIDITDEFKSIQEEKMEIERKIKSLGII